MTVIRLRHTLHACYLQYIPTGGPTVHVLVVMRDFDTVDDPLELAQVAVSGYNLTSGWIELPHTQSLTA